MKILILSPFPPPTDGIANHTRDIVTVLEARGHEVRILSPGRGQNHDSVTRGLTITPRRVDRDLADWADALFCQFAISALRAGTTGALALMKRARLAGKPVIVAVHEPSREPHLLGPVSWQLYHRALSRASSALVFSITAEHALLHASFKPQTTPVARTVHGVARVEPPTDEEIARVGAKYGVSRTTALQFGFIHPDKGVQLLIAAHDPQFRIAVAGTVRERRGLFRIMGIADKKYAQQIRDLDASLNAEVNWCGFVPGDEMHALVAAAGVLVLPYTKGAQSGIVAVAQSVGAPIIASPLLAEQVGDGALIVDPTNADALRDAIASVIHDVQLRANLSENSCALGEIHTYAQLVLDLEILMTQTSPLNPRAN